MAASTPASIDDLRRLLAAQRYIADDGLATSVYLALKLARPLLLEGEAGVGKTEVAKVLSAALGADLIRLQCYEGLDVNHAVYEWNYARQLIEIRLAESEGAPAGDRHARAGELFGPDFLIERPLLQALRDGRPRPPVLLIDELDRADEEFEGYLLELLSDFQITIPELGTIRASSPPVVVITSNRTRELHDALKRRCVYAWIDYPSFDKELQIINSRVPDAPATLAAQVTGFVQELRRAELYKVTGVSETLDWVAALVALDRRELDAATIERTLGIVLKTQEDMQNMRGDRIQDMLNRAKTPGARTSGPTPPPRAAERARHACPFCCTTWSTSRGCSTGWASTCRRAGRGTSRRPWRTSTWDGGSDFYHTLRSLLVHRVDDLALFDEAFRVFWRRPHGEWTATDLSAMGETRRSGAPEYESEAPPGADGAGGDDGRQPGYRVERMAVLSYSDREALYAKDFEHFTAEEVAAAEQMMAELDWELGERRSKRWTAGQRPRPPTCAAPCARTCATAAS